MNFVCKIDLTIYSCVSPDITTDVVIITDERIRHIQSRHPLDYERYHEYIKSILEDPHYIIEDNKPNTAFILKEFVEDQQRFRLILRLHTTRDVPGRQNSILTFQYIKEREYQRLIHNKKILYSSPNL